MSQWRSTALGEYQMSSQHTAIAVTFENAIIFPFEIQMLQFHIQNWQTAVQGLGSRNVRVTRPTAVLPDYVKERIAR